MQDKDFISVLNKIRNGSYVDNDLSFINKMVEENDLKNDKIVLTPYKNKAATINQQGLQSLDSPEVEFRAKLTGTIKSSSVPAEELLILKEGAKVMFVKNNRPLWVNGSLGTVEEISDGNVIVSKDGATHTVETATWEEYKYKYNPQTGILDKEVVGTFTQIPLILAWAITIHKGQGTTLAGAHIDLDRGSFDFGQTYVALSRTRKLSDMTIDRPIMDSDIKVDQRINDYYESVEFDEGGSEDEGGAPPTATSESDEFVIGKEIWWPIIKGGVMTSLVEATIVNLFVDKAGIEMAEIEFKSGKRINVTLEELEKYKPKEKEFSSFTFGE